MLSSKLESHFSGNFDKATLFLDQSQPVVTAMSTFFYTIQKLGCRANAPSSQCITRQRASPAKLFGRRFESHFTNDSTPGSLPQRHQLSCRICQPSQATDDSPADRY